MMVDVPEGLARRLAPAEPDPELPPELRPAAVLTLIFDRGDDLVVPLIVRTDGGGIHSGQLALPGGGREAEDVSLLETALRESREEVGIATAPLRILGRLTEVHVGVSGFVVVPFVAWLPAPPRLFPNAAEVAALAYLPLSKILDPDAAREIPNPPGSRFPVMYEY